ncbi:flavodoxin [Endozoicomonas elysicola]|uniref:Flavodoxin n=1 Tax=Endozoicomonas elysicola TaxID=305900 RepID=A0A081KE72_9GAMM|nr:flavodoxin [Endozoicomonas elysicola]KEI72448.1 flavodoxin FldA [Endozoicomonas elysicola]
MATIAVIYGSDTGNTRRISEIIAARLKVDCLDVADCSAESLTDYEMLIMGAPTVNQGELQSDWDYFMPDLEDADLSGIRVALFGLGDQKEYGDTFVDALDNLAEAVEQSGAELVGQWPVEGYEFTESRAVRGNHFVGLALDEDNQPELTGQRLQQWLESMNLGN